MNSREKGKRGERQWRDELRAQGYAARRGQQFAGSADSPDVVCDSLPWIHFEVKAVERLNIEDAMEQARRDSKAGVISDRSSVGRVPIVAHRRSFRAWLVTMDSETFFNFLRGVLPPEGEETRTGRRDMKIKANNGNFEPCPEYTGKAVCVDVTPLRKQPSQFGERDVFKVVFEVDMEKEDGTRFCVWSRYFTPSLNEKANFRKFVRGWFGRDLSKQELEDFDTETLVGKPAQLVVVHEHRDNETYANIMACLPDKSGETLPPSGKFIRSKDKPPKDGSGNGSARSGGAGTSVPANAAGAAGGSGYRRAQQPVSEGEDLGATKIHVGRCKGLEVRDLAPEQVQALIDNWLPKAKANAKPLADDKRLMAALEWWAAKQQQEDDNVPY
jgi:Holliday junction resolvase